jgi:hypothetical protein
MIRNDELNWEHTYENVKYIRPFCENGVVYGELNFENGETATFNMDEYDFFDLTPRKIAKFTTDFIY